MSENHVNHVSELLKKRAEIIERVRETLPSEASALEAISMALDMATESNREAAGPYASVVRGIDALVMHLRKAGKPLRRRQLVREVVAEGWAHGDPLAYTKLWDVVRYHCDEAKVSVIMRQPGDMIALAKGAKK